MGYGSLQQNLPGMPDTWYYIWPPSVATRDKLFSKFPALSMSRVALGETQTFEPYEQPEGWDGGDMGA